MHFAGSTEIIFWVQNMDVSFLSRYKSRRQKPKRTGVVKIKLEKLVKAVLKNCGLGVECKVSLGSNLQILKF